MADAYFDLKATFEIYGRKFEIETGGKWKPNESGLDPNIVNWLLDCQAEAAGRHQRHTGQGR